MYSFRSDESFKRDTFIDSTAKRIRQGKKKSNEPSAADNGFDISPNLHLWLNKDKLDSFMFMSKSLFHKRWDMPHL